MSTLWLILTPILVTWLPAGYLASRIWNALGLACDHFSDRSRNECPRNHDVGWDWNRPFKDDNGPIYFGLGVLLGWIMLVFFAYFIVGVTIIFVAIEALRAIGRRLMPQQAC